MNLEIDEVMKEAFRSKETNFKDTYGKELNEWYQEVEYYFKKGDTDKLKKMLGYTYFYVAKKLGFDIEDIYREDAFIVSLGFNPDDVDYISDFAMAMIIEDEFKIHGDVTVTEMLHIENVNFKGELGEYEID